MHTIDSLNRAAAAKSEPVALTLSTTHLLRVATLVEQLPGLDVSTGARLYYNEGLWMCGDGTRLLALILTEDTEDSDLAVRRALQGEYRLTKTKKRKGKNKTSKKRSPECCCYQGCVGADEPWHQHADDPCPAHPDVLIKP